VKVPLACRVVIALNTFSPPSDCEACFNSLSADMVCPETPQAQASNNIQEQINFGYTIRCIIPLLLLKGRFRFSAYLWLLRPRSHELSDHLIFFALPISRPSNCKTSQAMILLFLLHDVRAGFLLTRWLNESDWTRTTPARRRPRGPGRTADRTQSTKVKPDSRRDIVLKIVCLHAPA
jgi:hypothetical protein